jgi:hypothetical protein
VGATLSVTGADRAWLESGGQRWLPGAAVPPGRYAVKAVFGGGAPVPAGEITVSSAAGAVALRCDPGFQLCSLR